MKLEITKESAVNAHNEASAEGKKLLENLFGKKIFTKDIKEIIKTFDDVLSYLNIDKDDFNSKNKGLSKDEIAYRKLKLIVQVLNEGWTPNWSNGKWNKWDPWFDMDDYWSAGRFSFRDADYRGSYSVIGSRLCFKSEDLATYAGKQFLDIYRDFFIIN